MIAREMGGRSGWWLAVLTAVVVRGEVVSEGASASRPVAPPRPVAALPVAVWGCDHLLAEPRCLRSQPRPLVLWLEGEWAASDLSLSFEDVPLGDTEVRTSADERGVLVELDPPAATGQLVWAHADGRRFALALAPVPEAFARARDEVGALVDGGDARAARDRTTALREGLDPLDAHLLDCLDAGLAMRAGDAAATTLPWRLEAAPAPIADALGIDRAHANAAYVAIVGELDYVKAQRHVDALQARPLDLEGQISRAYYGGLLARQIGRFDEALASLEHAGELAERARHTSYLGSILAEQAVVLAELGRFDEAEALAHEATTKLTPDDPILTSIRHEATWVRILHREDEPGLPDPSDTLQALIEHPDLTDADANKYRLNLAIAASQSNDHARAERVLAPLDRTQLNREEQVFFELVKARIAHQRGEPSLAREHLERGRLLAELVGHEAFLLRVRLARARLEQQVGDRAAARREHELAEALEDRLALGIGAQLGRSTFSTARRHDRAAHVELLLELGDRAAALCTVLGARARHLRSLSVRHGSSPVDPARRERQRRLLLRHAELRDQLEQRRQDDWKLSVAELEQLRERNDRDRERIDALATEAMALVEREPAPWSCDQARSPAREHALLTMHPAVAADGWWVMLDRAGVVETVPVRIDRAAGAGGAEQAAAQALTTLVAAGRLAGVRTLTVVPLGELGAVDVHRLDPLRGLDGLRVVYGLGLGRAARAVAADGSAVAIAGGGDDLRDPAAEVDEVRAAMGRHGWTLRDAWAPADETQPTLLHYAGHGHHAGPSGWDSTLELAEGPLSAEQIIAHQHAPAVVVLGACDAAATDAKLLDGGMNMASAFLLAGAELVIAPSRPVADADARALAQQLYRAPPSPRDAAALADALVEGLTTAQREGGRFGAWRAWGP